MRSFAIASPFHTGGRSSRDNPDRLFTAIGVHHHEDAAKHILSKGDEPFLLSVGIRNSQGKRIFQNGDRISKVRSMFFSIQVRFDGIPLVFHGIDYMHNCTYRQGDSTR